jgi:hypothetical protein
LFEIQREKGEGVMASLGRGLKGGGSYWRGDTSGVMARVIGLEREKRNGGEERADRWGRPVSERKRGRAGLGCCSVGLGPGSAQLGWAPLFLLFFLFCFFSYFLFSYFFYIFCIRYLIRFKLVSEIF